MAQAGATFLIYCLLFLFSNHNLKINGNLMVDENKTGKHIARTIAMPALLVISLLAAKLVMHSKTDIRLSAPIELSRSGLSLSMPSGNGWKCEEKWTYEDNVFSTSSVLVAGGAANRSYAQCRYLLATRAGTPQERLDEEYAEAKVIETGQITADQLTVNWASVNTDAGVEIILGVCELAGGRQLEIEVLQTAEEQGLAQQVFEKIVKSIRFSDNGLLQAGARLINGLDIARDNDSSVSFFTIADPHNNIIGFTMDAMALVRTDANTTINAADYYYLRGTVSDEQISYFRGDANLRQFTWRVETNSRIGSKGIEMTADSGVLTVRRLRAGLSVNRRTGRETSEYELGETAVPDIILDPVLTKVMDSNGQAVIIDVIRSEGIITPAYIEKMPPAKGQTDSNSVRMEWLDGRNFRHQAYYDNSKKLVKILLEQKSTYTLNRSDPNEIIKLFPERADYVSDKHQILDRKL
jgi:hypothetical protein